MRELFMKRIKNFGLFMVFTLSAYAQDGQVYDSAPLDVDGYVKEANVTDRELEFIRNELTKQKNQIHLNREKKKGYRALQRTTEKLANETEDYLDEKNQSQKVIDEYNQRIQCLMAPNANPKDCRKYSKKDLDEVKEIKAGVEKIRKEIAVEKKKEDFGQIVKIIPQMGITTFSSEELNGIESAFSGGVRAESYLGTRFSMGITFRYTTLETLDANSAPMYSNFGNGFNTGFNPFFNSYYQSFPGNPGFVNLREIQYRNLGLGIYGKYFFIRGNKFQLYGGLGINYARTKLFYNDAGQLGFNSPLSQFGFGEEEFVSHDVAAEVSLGSEIMFTEMFGLDGVIGYSRGFGNIGNRNSVSFNNFDQVRLQQLSEQIANSNALSFYLGAIISF